jgi:phosphoribosyl 1,2-cyclic phosphodiesterase
MKIKVWGCRGSLPSPGPENVEFGGNTSCVEIIQDDICIILDGGSGIQRLGTQLSPEVKRIDLFLTHLHLDHIMGLGFFQQLYNPNIVVNVYGPAGSNENLVTRLRRYFSPPLFPVRLQELPCQLNIIEIDETEISIGNLKITSSYVCHPGPTVGYRIETEKHILAYIPDNEPALGSIDFPNNPEWTAGYAIAKDADLLLHDAQYKNEEYSNRIGWGHSSLEDAIKFADMCKVKKLLFFHHDPLHNDNQLKNLLEASVLDKKLPFEVGMCAEGMVYDLKG